MQGPYFFPPPGSQPPILSGSDWVTGNLDSQQAPTMAPITSVPQNLEVRHNVAGSAEAAGANGRRGSVLLSSLPQELRHILSVYDLAGDGMLHPSEINKMAERMKNEREGRLSFDAFPKADRKELEEFDVNGDQVLDTSEVVTAFRALKRERQKSAALFKGLIGVVVFSIIMLVAIGVLTVLVEDRSKEYRVKSDVMVSAQDGNPVKTSSTDFQLTDGVLIATCAVPGACEARPITVNAVQKKETAVLSSQLDDEDLINLEELTLRQLDSFIHIKINAVARYTETASRHGSVVVLYSSLGELTLDGEAIFFHERLEGAFLRAGFTVDTDADTNGRRLLGIVQILGLFNSFNKAITNAGGGDDNPQLDLINFPLTFVADVTTFQLCPKETGCVLNSEQIEYATHMPDGRQAFTKHEKSYSQTVNGAFVAKSVETTPQYPSQERVTVQNTTHKISYQVFDGRNYYCNLENNTELESVLARRSRARRVGPNTPDVAEFNFAGYVTINGRYCRHIKVCEEADEQYENITYNENRTEILSREPYTQTVRICYDVLEDYFTKVIYRMEMYDMIFQFDKFTEISSELNNPLSGDEVDLDALLASCDSTAGRVVPEEWVEGKATVSVVTPHPSWGQPVIEDLDEMLSLVNGSSPSDSVSDATRRSLESYRELKNLQDRLPRPEQLMRARRVSEQEYRENGLRRAGECSSQVGIDIPEASPIGFSWFDVTDCFSFEVLATEFSLFGSVSALLLPCPEMSGDLSVRMYPNGDVEFTGTFSIKYCILTCLSLGLPFVGLLVAHLVSFLPDLCGVGSLGVGYKDFREDDDWKWNLFLHEIQQGGPDQYDELKDKWPKIAEQRWWPRRPMFGSFEGVFIAGSLAITTPPNPLVAGASTKLDMRVFLQVGCGTSQMHTNAKHWGISVDWVSSAFTNTLIWKASASYTLNVYPGEFEKPPKQCDWSTEAEDKKLQKTCRFIDYPKVYDFKDRGKSYYMRSMVDDPLGSTFDADADSWDNAFSKKCSCFETRDRICSHFDGDFKKKEDFKEKVPYFIESDTWWYPGTYITSQNGVFSATVLETCEFVVYETSYNTNFQREWLWKSNSRQPEGKRPCRGKLFGDGELVLRDKDNKMVWQSGTGGNTADRIEMDNGGRLKIQGSAGLVWKSGVSNNYAKIFEDVVMGT